MGRQKRTPGSGRVHQAKLTLEDRNALRTTLVALGIVDCWLELALPQATAQVDGHRVNLRAALAQVLAEWERLNLGGTLGFDLEDDSGLDPLCGHAHRPPVVSASGGRS
jgi:hypothetical protein